MFTGSREDARFTKSCDAANGSCYCYESYGGERCETEVIVGAEAQTSGMSSYIYPIVGGSAGAFIIIVIILVLCYCCLRRRDKKVITTEGDVCVVRQNRASNGDIKERYSSLYEGNHGEVSYAEVGILQVAVEEVAMQSLDSP